MKPLNIGDVHQITNQVIPSNLKGGRPVLKQRVYTYSPHMMQTFHRNFSSKRAMFFDFFYEDHPRMIVKKTDGVDYSVLSREHLYADKSGQLLLISNENGNSIPLGVIDNAKKQIRLKGAPFSVVRTPVFGYQPFARMATPASPLLLSPATSKAISQYNSTVNYEYTLFRSDGTVYSGNYNFLGFFPGGFTTGENRVEIRGYDSRGNKSEKVIYHITYLASGTLETTKYQNYSIASIVQGTYSANYSSRNQVEINVTINDYDPLNKYDFSVVPAESPFIVDSSVITPSGGGVANLKISGRYLAYKDMVTDPVTYTMITGFGDSAINYGFTINENPFSSTTDQNRIIFQITTKLTSGISYNSYVAVSYQAFNS